MFVAFFGIVVILQANFIAGHGNQVLELPGGAKVILVTPSDDSDPRPEHRDRDRYPDGVKVIQLGGDNGYNRDTEDSHRDRYPDGIKVIQLGGDNGYNRDKDRNSNLPDGILDFLKRQNITDSSGVQVIKLGGDYGHKRRHSHEDDDEDEDDDDDSVRRIFKLFRFRLRRGGHRSNAQFRSLQGRDFGNHRALAQDRSDYNHPVAARQADVPRTQVKVIRQSVPRRLMVRNLRSSQAHLTNMQTLSFPVFEDEWQMA